jgi:hypothetical protein
MARRARTLITRLECANLAGKAQVSALGGVPSNFSPGSGKPG